MFDFDEDKTPWDRQQEEQECEDSCDCEYDFSYDLDHFATLAMRSLLLSPKGWDARPEHIAQRAYAIAEAMVREQERYKD